MSSINSYSIFFSAHCDSREVQRRRTLSRIGTTCRSPPELYNHNKPILEPGDALNAARMLIHPLSWSFTGITRICCSFQVIEAYMLSNVVEHGLRIWAVVFNMKGQLNTDQTIDLSALKQLIWDNHDGLDEEPGGSMSCYFRWVDTSATLSKKITSQRLGNTSSTNILDTRPNEKNPLSKYKRKVEKTEGMSRNDRKFLMLEVLHARCLLNLMSFL